MHWYWNPRRIAAIGRSIALPALIVGCGIPDSTLHSFNGGTGDRFYRGAVSDDRAALAGDWRSSFYVVTGSGATHQRTTTWAFRADGTFTLSVTTIDLASGTSTTSSESGTFLVDGGFLVITYTKFPRNPVRYAYGLRDGRLAFGGTEYTRAG